MKIIGMYGWSGSGKTDLICRVLKYLSQYIKIATMKHTHHNVKIDKKNKDSYKHRISGAHEILIWGENNWSLIHNGRQNENIKFENLCKKFSKKTDLLIVEGFKKGKFPKIEIYNSSLKKKLIMNQNSKTIAIVYDKIDEEISQIDLPKFSFSETENISKFIVNFLKIDKNGELF